MVSILMSVFGIGCYEQLPLIDWQIIGLLH